MRQPIVLHVDLSHGTLRSELVPKQVTTQFLGGRGVNAYYAYKMIKPGIDPLGPENVLIVGPGTLTGTTAPCSGRTSVTCKSPVTNLYNKTNSGGHWGAELKYAGYDYIIIAGVSSHPVYLWIDNGKMEIRDAREIWGSDIKRTNQLIREDLGDEEIQVATIGPAGENRVMCGYINFSWHHAAGRAGAGAVMGSKNLKAIAVRGTGGIKVADPINFINISNKVRQELANDSGTKTLAQWGTSGSLPVVNELYSINNRNFQNNYIEYAEKLSGQYLVEAGYLKGRIACFSCSTACHRYVVNQNGPFRGVNGAGPEFEAMASLGSATDVSDTEAILMANQICNQLGLDVVSAGSYVAWAMECYEKGMLTKEDSDGIDLRWGNGEALVQMIEKIGRREGRLGDLLAKGIRRAKSAKSAKSV